MLRKGNPESKALSFPETTAAQPAAERLALLWEIGRMQGHQGLGLQEFSDLQVKKWA